MSALRERLAPRDVTVYKFRIKFQRLGIIPDRVVEAILVGQQHGAIVISGDKFRRDRKTRLEIGEREFDVAKHVARDGATVERQIRPAIERERPLVIVDRRFEIPLKSSRVSSQLIRLEILRVELKGGVRLLERAIVSFGGEPRLAEPNARVCRSGIEPNGALVAVERVVELSFEERVGAGSAECFRYAGTDPSGYPLRGCGCSCCEQAAGHGRPSVGRS